MGDDSVPRPDQEQAADRLAEMLAAAVIPVAKSRARMTNTAPSQEQTVTIKLLAKLGQNLPDFCRRAYLGEVGSDGWAELSNALQVAARASRAQVVIAVHDTGDSGGR